MSSREARYTKMLSSPETSATVLHAILRDKYGEDIYEWEPETLMLEVRDDFQVDMPPEAMDRWSALQTAMTSDAFFTRTDAFLSICNALASGDPMFEIFDPTSPVEIAWGLLEVSLNRDILPFSPFVVSLVQRLLAEGGLDLDSSMFFGPLRAAESGIDELDIRQVLTMQSTTAHPNAQNVDSYALAQLHELVGQLNELPRLQHVDDILLRKPSETIVSIVEAD